MHRASHIKWSRVFFYIAITLICMWCIGPFVWMIFLSIKPANLVYVPEVWRFTPSTMNFEAVFHNQSVMHFLGNSVVVAVISTLISLVLGSLGAYGFARFEFKKKEKRAFWILSMRMIPPITVVIPFFIMSNLLKIFDTQLVLIIVYLLMNIPFTIWMMRGFFEDIPISLEEAARVDGCTTFQVLLRIILPLAAPGMITTAIFCIINAWNEFVFAMFLTSASARTLPTSVSMFLSFTGVMWGQMCAVGIMSAAPVIIGTMLVQKHITRGLTFGAVKG